MSLIPSIALTSKVSLYVHADSLIRTLVFIPTLIDVETASSDSLIAISTSTEVATHRVYAVFILTEPIVLLTLVDI